MTIIRNLDELSLHNAKTDGVLGENTKAALAARERNAMLLIKWLMAPETERAAFNSLFGDPPAGS